MKKQYLFLVLASLMLTLASCGPDVEACFTEVANGADVTFDATCSLEAVSYEWDFGDGATSTQVNPTHSYTSGGDFIVTLAASDKKGKISDLSKTVTIDACQFTCVNGSCQNGSCVCASGYEGPNCSTAWNAKFPGTYTMNETCNASGTSGPYTVTVSAGNTASTISIAGLWQIANSSYTCDIGQDGLSLTGDRQQINGLSFDIEVTSGTMNASGTTINLVYKVYQTGNTFQVDECTAVMVK